MLFEHYRAEPIDLTHQVVQQAMAPHGKPRGLWVSTPGEDDWPSWCRSEDFALERLAVRHLVDLDLTRILVLANVAAITEFDLEYGTPIQLSSDFAFHAISWERVAERYAGIVISPYQWSLRLEGRISKWYYGWDCASGCVWDTSAIKSIKIA